MIFSNKEAEERYPKLQNNVRVIAEDMDNWSQKFFAKEITITSTVSTAEEDKGLGRVSDTHRTGRAIDIRIRDWDEVHLREFIKWFNIKYNAKYGAVTKEGPSLIVHKPHGTGPHLHIQVKRNFKHENKKKS